MLAKRLFIGILLIATSSQAQVIGFTECIYNVQFAVPFDMLLQYDGPDDILGAAVRISGIPIAWIHTVTPPPHINPCGMEDCDLFINGAYLTYPECQTTPPVQLFQITIVPTTVESNLVFSPEKPLDSPIDCPFVTLCDEPVFTMMCVGCDQAFVNHSDPTCSVAVEETTWTSVLGLYR